MKPDVTDWLPQRTGPVFQPGTKLLLFLLSFCINKTHFGNRAIHLSNFHVLCVSLAASGDLDGLEIWNFAGADFTKPGYDGRTAVDVVGSRGLNIT